MKFNYARAVSRPVETSLFLGVALGAMCIPSLASAQGAAAQPAPVPEDAIIVTGLRASLENALEIRRNADVVLDGISADDIGSTPDLNLGEALQRIPGVQINREEGRRDATISVRGLPGNFTKTTIQGQSVASTSRGITFNAGNPFGIYDSSIFNGANVVKSFTADTPSGGLAAVVDLRINSAFDRREGVVLRAEVNYEESTEEFVPAFFGSVAKKLTDRFAVYGTVAYTKLDFRREGFSINGYDAFNSTQLAGYAAGTIATGLNSVQTIGLNGPNDAFNIAPVGENGLNNSVIFASNPRQLLQRDQGYRVSGGAGFAFELTENITFRVDGIYTRRDLSNSTQDNLQSDISNGTLAPQDGQPSGNQTLVTPLSNPVFIGTLDFDEDGVEENVFHVPRVFGSDATISHANRFFPALEESFAIYPQFNFENDEWRLDLIGTYSEATGIEQLLNLDFRPRIIGRITSGPTTLRGPAQRDTNNNGIDDNGTGNFVLVDSGLGNLNNIFLDAQADPRLLTFVPSSGGVTLTGTNPGDVRSNVNITTESGLLRTDSQSSILVQGFNSQVDRDLKSIDFELARKFENSIINEISVGGYYSQESSVRRRLDLGGLGANVLGLTAPEVSGNLFVPSEAVSQGGAFLGGEIPGAERDNFITLNIPLVRDTLLPGTRTLPAGVTFAPTANNLRDAFTELTAASAGTITVAELLAVLPEVPNSGGFLLRSDAGFLRGANVRNNFTSERDNLELYAQTKFDLSNTTEIPLRGNFGLRYINTDLSGVGTSLSLGIIDSINALREASNTPLLEFRQGARDPQPGSANFSRLLPSVNFIYDITPNLVARAAYYETFEAFDLAEFVPTPTTITTLQGGEDPDDITQVNPTTVISVSSLGIVPRSSKGFDLGLSWYNRKGSVVALGFFRKTLENDISTFSNFCPSGESFTFEGQTFSDLQPSGTNRCTFDGEGETRPFVRINTSLNNPDDVIVTGFEGQIQQNLDFLPGPLKNTGFIANFTRTRSDGENNARLVRVAEFTYNLIGYYEDKLFQARLAWNHQSEIELPNGGSFGGGARRVAPRGQLDFSGAIRPAKGFEVRFEVFNITETPRQEFLQFEELFRNYQFDGRTFGLSATYRFN